MDVEASPVATFLTDLSGDLVYANKRALELFGRASIAVLGKRWTQVVQPEDRQRVLDAWSRASGKLLEIDLEFRLLRDDGQVLDVRAQAAPATWGEPLRHGYMGVVEDISQRKRTAAQLREAHGFLERAEQIAGLGAWELDLRTRIVKWSDQTCRILDLPPGQQPTFGERNRYLVDPDAQRLINQHARQAILTGKPWDIELPIVTATGRPIWIRTVGCAEFEGRRAVRLVSAVQDITAQRETKRELVAATALLLETRERQTRAIEASGVVLWEVDYGTGQLVLSENWRQLMGDPDAPLVTTFEALAQHVPEEELDMMIAAMVAGLKGTADRYSVEHRLRRKDGSVIWIQSEGRATKWDERGRVLHASGTNYDISDRKQAEKLQRDVLSGLVKQAVALDAQTTAERKAAALFSFSPAGTAFVRKERVIELCNERMETMFGYAPGELRGQSDRVLCTSDEQWKRFGELFREQASTGGIAEIEAELVHKAGHRM